MNDLKVLLIPETTKSCCNVDQHNVENNTQELMNEGVNINEVAVKRTDRQTEARTMQ